MEAQAQYFENYVSADAVAQFVQSSPKTILRLAREGKIPAHTFGDGTARRHWRFKLSELDIWMKSRNNPLAAH